MKGERMHRLTNNRNTFVGFVLLYMSAAGGVFSPMLRQFSYLVMRAAGFRYLTAENVYTVFYHPIVYLALLLSGILIACLGVFEIAGILFIMDACYEDRCVTLMETILFASFCVRDLFKKHYRGLIAITLVLLPVYHLGMAINLLNSYSLFALFLRTLRRPLYSRILLTGAIVFYVLMFRWCFYVLHFYVLENFGTLQSLRHSAERSKKQGMRHLLSVFAGQFLVTLCYILLSIVMLALIGIIKKTGILSGLSVSSFQVTYLRITESVFYALVVPFMLWTMGEWYYRGRKSADYRSIPCVRARKANEIVRRYSGSGKIEKFMFYASIGIFAVYAAHSAKSQFTLRIEHLRSVEVTAHRGASMFYPENTMAAFKGAVEQGAAWIELDVQETRDGEVIIMHDSNLKRTTGIDKNIWEVDYAQIQDVDAGSFFNTEYAGERIPLLRDAIAFAKEQGIRLNIEIKPTGHEVNLVSSTLDAVEEADFSDMCVITSQKYDVLRQVKARNEEIATVYVMGLAYGAINRLKAADAFSIRSTSITQSLVTDLHNRGLEVYAWTVDSRANINRMINLGVDNIITNNVPLVLECINVSRTESILLEMLKMLRDRFR